MTSALPLSASAPWGASDRLSRQDGLAIVGMNGVFPDAVGVSAYWQNLLRRHCSLRWVEDRLLPEEMRSQADDLLAALMPPLPVKPQTFRLLPKTAQAFDPRVLPLLSVIRPLLATQPQAQRDKTLVILCSQRMLPPGNAANFVANRLRVLALFEQIKTCQDIEPQLFETLKTEFTHRYDRAFPDPGLDGFLAESSSLVASLISKTFDLGGGHLALDATCASALPALQIAWNALYSGHNDAALVVALSPEAIPSRWNYCASSIFTRQAVLPFDQAASGSALGEGIGAVLLKRLPDAEAEERPIQGVIRGIGYSSDGQGSGFVAPCREGQIRAMEMAYQLSGLDPEQVQLIEAHGTGTPRGDLTELESMAALFGDTPRRIPLGSVKGNIGHLLEAAGMAGLIKACCALQAGMLPPSLFRHPRVELRDQFTQFELIDQPRPWPDHRETRLAAISAFGFGGINGHLLVEAHPSTAQGMAGGSPKHSVSLETNGHRPVLRDSILGDSTLGDSVSQAPILGEPSMETNAVSLSEMTPPSSEPTEQSPGWTAETIAADLLQIISHCTGYEVGELKLDHDLDMDLGVDSLKHIEILLKIGQHFQLQPRDDDQITDFPTIQSLAEMIQSRLGETVPVASAVSLAEPTAPPHLPDPVTDSTGMNPTSVNSTGVNPTGVDSNKMNLAVKQVTVAIAALRNYEPAWLQPHLRLTADLGLTSDELARLQTQLNLTLADDNLSIQAVAQQFLDLSTTVSRADSITPSKPESATVSKPESATSSTTSVSDPAVLQPVSQAVASPAVPKSPPSTEPWQLLLGTADPDRIAWVPRLRTAIQRSQSPVVDLKQMGGETPFACLVNPAQPNWLEQLTETLSHHPGQTMPEAGIWWGSAKNSLSKNSPPKMAWLFPGSGAFSGGLVEDLIDLSPQVAAVVAAAKAAFAVEVGQELSFEPSTDPLWQRPATVTISTAIATYLKSLGLTPDAVAGHSVGELTACHLAGAFDLETLIRLTIAPFNGLSAYPKGAMAALLGPEADLYSLVQQRGGRVVVSNRNAPQQIVVSGAEADIQQLLEKAHQTGIKAQKLAVQIAFHSPLLAEAHQQYRQALQAVEFQTPTLPVVSGLTGDCLPWSSLGASQIRALLDCAFIGPVNHVAQLQRLADLGIQQFVDGGPSSRLSRLARENLSDNLSLNFSENYLPLAPAILAMHHTKANPRRSLLAGVAQLYMAGHPIQAPTLPIAPEISLPAATRPPDRAVLKLTEPIAVVGLGGLFPDAQNSEEFWQHLLAGHSAIHELPQGPPHRWSLDRFYDPDRAALEKSYSKIGAFVPDFDFKPMQFRIPPKTAAHMDRAQKMALLATDQAFRDSGYDQTSFDRQRVRVIIGTSMSETQDLRAPRLCFEEVAQGFWSSPAFAALPKATQTEIIEQARQAINETILPTSEDSLSGGLPNIVAGRIALCFDLQGGNVTLDAACASSLAAVDAAIKALRLGEIDMVVAGGVDSAMSSASYVGFCKTAALSATGSYPFDARADGFVMGEGAGIILLKRLSDAERECDRIYAVIRGVGSASDGKARGITVPSVTGQALAMERAYADTGIDPASVGLIEAHGTSTVLGDATEFQSLTQVFGDRNHPLYLGSVKSTIGHLKAAAGIAGLIKAVLSVYHQQIPPTPTFESPSPSINLAESPFKINPTPCPWQHSGNTPRRVGVNAFGFGGTNFHCIVEAYDPDFHHSDRFLQEVQTSRLYRDFREVRTDSAPKEINSLRAPKEDRLSSPVESLLSPPKGVPNLQDALQTLEKTLAVIAPPDRDPIVCDVDSEQSPQALPALLKQGPLIGWIPPLRPQDLGSVSFRQVHGVKYTYIAGAMAGGIGSVAMVVAMAKAGMMGFFGAGGLGLDQIEAAILSIQKQLRESPKAAYGFNLLHTPSEPALEDRTVDLYLKHRVRKVSASAYLRLTPGVVRYRATGMKRTAQGHIEAPNKVFAKVSSLAVARQFFSPPPAALLSTLVSQGQITPAEAELAAQLPVAEDITAEADSGGHTDRRPLSVLLPQMLALRDQMASRYVGDSLGISLRVGAAGSMGDPFSVRAALAMGADYILTGSINQASCQADTSDLAKQLLAEATMADVVMAPAADMFEMGVQVQVLKRGTLYAQRARKLYDLYKTYDSLEQLPASVKENLENEIFRQPLAAIWTQTQVYWQMRDPRQLEKATHTPKHKLALVFRWYLGNSARWAQAGEMGEMGKQRGGRRSDFQIWCGPAMGLFNRWVADSPLAELANRDVVEIALALLRGAAVLTRAEQLRQLGVSVPPLSQLARPTVVPSAPLGVGGAAG